MTTSSGDASAARRPLLGALGRALRPLRNEERLLIATWLVGALVCVTSDAGGFTISGVFGRYLAFFARYLVYLFFATRLLFWLDERWQPRAPALRRLKLWFFASSGEGPASGVDRVLVRNVGELRGAPRPPILVADLEFVRLAMLLFVNLSVYSNIKVRVPFINDAQGDEFFKRADELMFGTRLIPWIESKFAESEAVARYFSNVYMHDYVWMVLLVFLLYLRRDLFALRWTVMSVCVVYIFGILMTAAYPSYGPCFLEPERFAWLKGTMVHDSQNFLVSFHNRSIQLIRHHQPFQTQAFAGIAAFPSLHVAHMVIMLVVALRTVPIYAVWMAWVTMATFIATIGFGWHYAVDGVGGIIIAVIFTEGLYRLMRRWDAQRATVS